MLPGDDRTGGSIPGDDDGAAANRPLVQPAVGLGRLASIGALRWEADATPNQPSGSRACIRPGPCGSRTPTAASSASGPCSVGARIAAWGSGSHSSTAASVSSVRPARMSRSAWLNRMSVRRTARAFARQARTSRAASRTPRPTPVSSSRSQFVTGAMATSAAGAGSAAGSAGAGVTVWVIVTVWQTCARQDWA